jgi:hypothetical protein
MRRETTHSLSINRETTHSLSIKVKKSRVRTHLILILLTSIKIIYISYDEEVVLESKPREIKVVQLK